MHVAKRHAIILPMRREDQPGTLVRVLARLAPDWSTTAMTADRDLLLGLLALQNGLISRDQLVTAFALWTSSGRRPMADVLADLGALAAPQGLLLDALHRQASYCGTPGGVSTPGLLNGLAGIGYGLLRLGFPQQVPAALVLEPTPAPWRDPLT